MKPYTKFKPCNSANTGGLWDIGKKKKKEVKSEAHQHPTQQGNATDRLPLPDSSETKVGGG